MCMRLVVASVSGGYKVLVGGSGGVLRVCVIVCAIFSRECDTVRCVRGECLLRRFYLISYGRISVTAASYLQIAMAAHTRAAQTPLPPLFVARPAPTYCNPSPSHHGIESV